MAGLDSLSRYADDGGINLPSLQRLAGPMSALGRAVRTLEKVSSFKAGTFVSWPASKGVAQGRVVSVHTGKVPGVVTQMTASTDAPVARVQLYVKSGKGWAPTAVHLGQPTSSLTAIDALPEPAEESTLVAGSFDEIRQRVQTAIRERLEDLTGAEHVWAYVYDIGADWAVYETGDCSDLFMVQYTLDDSGTVTLSEPVSVMRVISYVTDGEGAEGESVDTATETTGVSERIEGRVLGALGAAADGGRIFEVQIIAYGDSKNGRRYPESVMRQAVSMYEGAAAFDHHRTDVELNTGTTVGIVGHYRNVRASETGLVGELHLLPSATHTAELLDQTLANQEAGLPLLVGISHDVMTSSKPVTQAGRTFREVTAILAVNSADVVVNPAAGGMATRTVAGGRSAADDTLNPNTKGTPMNLKQLLAMLRAAETAAERAALLEQHAHVLEAAGLSGISVDDAVRMAESMHTAASGGAAGGDRQVETGTKLAKASALTSLVVERMLASANLPKELGDKVLAELPAEFTETELHAVVKTHQRIVEGLELAGLAPSVPHVEVTADSMDKKKAALDAMFAGDFRTGFRSFKEAYMAFTGRRPGAVDGSDFNREILRESASFLRNGERVGFDGGDRSIESATTTTWALALGDSITRRMVSEYGQPSLSTWRSVVSSIVPVQDFRLQRIERIGGYGTLPVVGQGAPYQMLTTPANDQEPTYTLTKRGGTEDLTLEAIANDDMRLISRIPTKLGLAAAQTIYRFVWDFFATNPTIYDGVALFAAGHNNTATTALSGANLSAARRAMRKQTAYGDTANVLSAVPKFLITVADLEELAFQLCTSPGAVPASAPVGGATDIPNLHQGVQPIVVDYWSSNSAWYVVADPTQIPTMEIGFYQGKEDPELFVQADPASGSYFSADKVTWKIRHIYSGAWLDFRSVQRGNV
jgi:hypothetical protein